jgi:c-di-GMP-binding flagellar brake protein YcgR
MYEAGGARSEKPSRQPRGAERRRDLRIDVSFPLVVVIDASKERMPAVVENVSLGGALLRTNTRLPLNAGVMFEIQMSDEKLAEIPAVVVRTIGTQWYGAAFAQLSDTDADHLMELASDYLKTANPALWMLG